MLTSSFLLPPSPAHAQNWTDGVDVCCAAAKILQYVICNHVLLPVLSLVDGVVQHALLGCDGLRDIRYKAGEHTLQNREIISQVPTHEETCRTLHLL